MIVKYTPTENKLINAINGTKVRNMNSEALGDRCSDLINKLFALSGQRPELNDVIALSILFRNELLSNFPNVTIEEIELSCEKGIRKEYGEYFGINIVTIHSWVKSHLNDTLRIDTAKKMLSTNSINDITELSEDKKNKIAEKSLQKNKEMALAHDFQVIDWDLFDIGNACYNQLDAAGKLDFTTDQKREFMERAKKKLTSEANYKKATHKVTVNAFNDLIKDIESKSGAPVIIRAKKIALFYYFKK